MQVEVGSLLFVPPVVADLSEQNMHDIACCTEALFQRTLLCVLLIKGRGVRGRDHTQQECMTVLSGPTLAILYAM